MTKSPKPISQDLLSHFYQKIYNLIPFNVAILDRDHNVIDTNENFHAYFGPSKGKKCYQVYKKKNKPCSQCKSSSVYEDGLPVVNESVGKNRHGEDAYYVVYSIPLRDNLDSPVEYVFELSFDVTRMPLIQQESNILFERVPCFITVIDDQYRIVRGNEAFRKNFGNVNGRYCYEIYQRRTSKCPNCPAAKTFRDSKIHRSKRVGVGREGRNIHYAVATSPFMSAGDQVAYVMEICTDVTELKRMENKLVENERLAAVGQTVAGLAHSIKNILMGLDGGKYMVGIGLKKKDQELIDEGWEILDRNFNKTSNLVKDFLSFSKGRNPVLKRVNPNDLVTEIYDLYKDVTAISGVELTLDLDKKMKHVPLDPEGIHTCLTNLVSNAIDACLMGEKKGSRVTIATQSKRGKLIIEVSDNGSGIDYEIKKKIFTTFFTTKGGEGTGLGLLTTKKIIHEHGGKIIVNSQKGDGARFRIEFSHQKLNTLFGKISRDKNQSDQ